MKREILFRGKMQCNDGWIHGFLSWSDTNRGRNYFVNNNIVFNETVGQFTGMTDKNGTKIFEGDILNEPVGGKDSLYHVFWDEDRFSFLVKNSHGEYYLDEICQSRCEVIGNIYDNK